VTREKSNSAISERSLLDDIDVQISTAVDNSEVSFHKTITFAPSDNSLSFLNLENSNRFIRNNVHLAAFASIATDYNDERENARRALYFRFMSKVDLLLASRENILITYEDWSDCFNYIFTHILDGKMVNCSSYSRGSAPIADFRGSQVKKADNHVVLRLFKKQKLQAEQDVREIMNILNLVLRDCNFKSTIASDNNELACTEDYSSTYRLSCPVNKHFRAFISDVQNNPDNNEMVILNLNALLDATEPEAILVVTTRCTTYGCAKLTVIILLQFDNTSYF
jgi:hypothetical protein